jgi:CRP-like cAMP-binding protein
VKTVPLFAHCNPALRNVLLMALKPQVFAPGGYIVREGEAGHEIYFISRGRAEISSQDGQKTHGTMESSDYFGHLSLMLGEVRTASVRALEFCDVFVLTGADFTRIKNEHAEFREIIKKVSKQKSAKASELMLEGVFL